MTYEIRTTDVFDKWFRKLKDTSAKIRIQVRLDRVEQGNLGDVKTIEGELSEMRFFFGPGYRIYYTVRETTVIILLAGGDKDSQPADIERAKTVLEELGNDS